MKDRRRLSTRERFLLLVCASLGWAAPADVAADGETLRAQGALEPVAAVDLRCEVDRPLPIIFVAPEGKVAKEGALLVELDAAPLMEDLAEQRLEVVQVQAEVAGIEASLASSLEEASAAEEVAQKALQVAEGALKVFLSEKGEYNLERKKRQAVIGASEKKLVAAKALSKLVEQRVQAGQGSSEEIHKLQLVLSEAEAQLTVARAELEFLEEVSKGQRVAELELRIVQRKFDLIGAHSRLRRSKREGEAALIATRTGLNRAESRLGRIEKLVAATKIHAPRDGTVAYPGGPGQGGIRRGAVVRPRQLLLRLQDTSRLKAVVRTSLEDAQKTAPGQAAKILVDAFPDRVFEGRVSSVGVARRVRQSEVAEIRVTMGNPGRKLRPGMTVVVEIDLSKE